MKRRKFIATAAMGIPMLSVFPADLAGIERISRRGRIEKRSLGRTGEKISMIGFGGIVVRDASPAESSSLVRLAIDSGVNYFDVAPSYGDAEIKLGPALEPYRKKVFLACKTQKRTKAEAKAELEKSLANLRTDHFDLYQHHAVTKVEDVKTIFGPGGAMEAFLEAKREGKIRYMGFSAHSVEAAMALMDGFDFDTIMFPLNFASWHSGNFGPQVLAKASEKKMGILALKAMVRGPLPKGADRGIYRKCWYEPLVNREDIIMGLRFTLSHPITSAIPPGEAELFKIALSVADKITPLSDPEILDIKTKGLATTPLFSYSA